MSGRTDVSGEAGTRTSRGLFIRALGLLGLVAAASWALAGNPLAAAAAVDRVQRVFVTNDETAPLPTRSAGGTVGIDPASNTVQVAGLPAAAVPFQQIVTDDTESFAGIMCAPIASPASGTVLRIRSVLMEAVSNGATNGPALFAYLRPSNQAAAESLDIPISLQGEENQAVRLGALRDTELLHGSVGSPATKQFNYNVCVEHESRLADSISHFSALVTGELVPAS